MRIPGGFVKFIPLLFHLSERGSVVGRAVVSLDPIPVKLVMYVAGKATPTVPLSRVETRRNK